jgi:hypothetical protein
MTRESGVLKSTPCPAVIRHGIHYYYHGGFPVKLRMTKKTSLCHPELDSGSIYSIIMIDSVFTGMTRKTN